MELFQYEVEVNKEIFLGVVIALKDVHGSGSTIHTIKQLATQYTNLHGDFKNYIGTGDFKGMNLYHSQAFLRYVIDNFLSDNYNYKEMRSNALERLVKKDVL
jgi:hypothetical protein